MLNSKEQLMSQARAGGYKPEILEKVYRLLDVFQQNDGVTEAYARV